MQEVIVKFKKLSETAHEPTRATPDAAGYDLYASGEQDFYVTHQGKISMVPTGIAVEIPDGYFGVLALRSSMAAKRGYAIPNGIGIIDSGYRGELKALVQYLGSGSSDTIQAGERIGQLIIMPLVPVRYERANDLSESDRGTGGFGSTGK